MSFNRLVVTLCSNNSLVKYEQLNTLNQDELVDVELEPSFTESDDGVNQGISISTMKFQCSISKLKELLSLYKHLNYFDVYSWVYSSKILTNKPVLSLDYDEEYWVANSD